MNILDDALHAFAAARATALPLSAQFFAFTAYVGVFLSQMGAAIAAHPYYASEKVFVFLLYVALLYRPRVERTRAYSLFFASMLVGYAIIALADIWSKNA